MVVAIGSLTDPRSGLALSPGILEMDAPVLEVPPQPLYENVVHPPAFVIHGNPDVLVLDDTSEIEGRKLTPLGVVEDLRLAIPSI